MASCSGPPALPSCAPPTSALVRRAPNQAREDPVSRVRGYQINTNIGHIVGDQSFQSKLHFQSTTTHLPSKLAAFFQAFHFISKVVGDLLRSQHRLLEFWGRGEEVR